MCLGGVGTVTGDDEVGTLKQTVGGPRLTSSPRRNFILNTMKDYLKYFKFVGDFVA